MADLLVARGAHVDIFIACRRGDMDRVRELLDADPGALEVRSHKTAIPGEGCSPLMMAVIGGHVELARLLIDMGADVNARGGHGNATPLHSAAWWCEEPELVDLLVDRGAELEVRDEQYENTPLGWAVVKGVPAIAERLIDRGATIHEKMLDDAIAGEKGYFRAFSFTPPETYQAVAEVLKKHRARPG